MYPLLLALQFRGCQEFHSRRDTSWGRAEYKHTRTKFLLLKIPWRLLGNNFPQEAWTPPPEWPSQISFQSPNMLINLCTKQSLPPAYPKKSPGDHLEIIFPKRRGHHLLNDLYKFPFKALTCSSTCVPSNHCHLSIPGSCGSMSLLVPPRGVIRPPLPPCQVGSSSPERSVPLLPSTTC